MFGSPSVRSPRGGAGGPPLRASGPGSPAGGAASPAALRHEQPQLVQGAHLPALPGVDVRELQPRSVPVGQLDRFVSTLADELLDKFDHEDFRMLGFLPRLLLVL